MHIKTLEEQWKILSPRKKQILWMVVNYHRMTHKQISDELGIAISTIGTYMSSILEITGCDDRFHLFVEWHEFLKDMPLPPTSKRCKKK